MDSALDRGVGRQPGDARVACGTGIVTRPGLRSVSVESRPLQIMLPPPSEFLWQYVTSTPLAGPVGEIGDDERAALERDVTTASRTFLDGDLLRLDIDAVLTTARK
jgi:hypothetical protein